jgi:hypothetical protein
VIRYCFDILRGSTWEAMVDWQPERVFGSLQAILFCPRAFPPAGGLSLCLPDRRNDAPCPRDSLSCKKSRDLIQTLVNKWDAPLSRVGVRVVRGGGGGGA